MTPFRFDKRTNNVHKFDREPHDIGARIRIDPSQHANQTLNLIAISAGNTSAIFGEIARTERA
jgi:hypothetical protein